MADLTKQGQWRTDLAMRQLALSDYEATGQYPKPYKPIRRTKNPPVIRPALAWLMSLPMEQAKRERRRKAERRDHYQSQPRAPRGDWDVAVIIRSSRRSSCRDWVAAIGVLALAALLISAGGGG